MTRALPVLFLVAALPACKKVQEAPEDLDQALHDLWTTYPAGDDDALAVIVGAIPELVDVDAIAEREGWQDGAQSPLSDEEVALAEGSEMALNAAAAIPLFTLSRYRCDLAHHEDVLVYHDQNELYDVYDGYSRTYIDDAAAYLAGDLARAEWRGTIDATIPTLGSYGYGFRSGIRRVELEDGEALVTRTFMESPAVWDNETPTFPQDYQIEAFVPVGEDIVHLYGVWREMDLGWMGDMNDTVVARTTINQMFKWDENTEVLCADGVPATSP